DLPEVLTRSDLREHLLLAVDRHVYDVGLAVREDVEAIRGIALPRDRRAARERELAELAGRGDELLLGEARQDLRQVLVVRVADLHEEGDRRGDLEHLLLAVDRHVYDVGLAVREDVEAIRGIALPRDRRAARERELAELAGRGDELLLGEARQDLRQVLVVRVADLHEERDRRGD